MADLFPEKRSLREIFDISSGLKPPPERSDTFDELIQRSKSLKGQGALGKLLNAFSLQGTFGTRRGKSFVDLPDDRVSIGEESLGAGGRAGVTLPIGDVNLDLGASGFFNKYKLTFPDELISFGAPERITGVSKRLTGIDAALTSPAGTKLSFGFNTPTSKERSFRFGLSGAF